MAKPRTLVGAHEIEERYGLNRMQVYRLLRSGDFPEPAAELRHGRVWDEAEVAKAVTKLRKAGRINAQGFVVPWRFLNESKASA
jgi:predicted DNA-binding transcriptional regulator AlpA